MKTPESMPSENALVVRKEPTRTRHMTVSGTIFKTIFLLILVSCSSFFVWNRFSTQHISHIQNLLKYSAPITLVVGWVTYFKPHWAFLTGPIYALSQGVFIGYFSTLANLFFPGIVMQAVPLTFSVLFGMLLLYGAGLIKLEKKRQSMIMGSIVAISITYLMEYILLQFGIKIPYIHEGSIFSMAFSMFVVVLASFTLILDFQYIVQGEESKAPKHMEWYSAYSLMVTLIWLYIEILEMLIKASKKKKKKKKKKD